MKIIALIVAPIILVLGLASAIFLPRLFAEHVVNSPDTETQLSVPDPLSLYSGDDIGFSFLYPTGMSTGWSDADGAYIYAGAPGGAPYVLVYRDNTSGMTPEKHFKATDKLLLDTFSNLQSTQIMEVPVGDKTLYMTRYQVQSGGVNHVIDRYIEIYPKYFIQYTAISDTAGSLDTPLYYAISTLKVADNAYTGSFSKRVSKYSHPETGIQISIPDMLKTNDLTIGYFSSSADAVLLAVVCTEDDTRQPIYNRQDFLDRAAASPDFVANRLGADTATFGSGSELTLGGKSFYCYPMTMVTGNENFSGTLCIANAPETGCILLCYAANTASPSYGATLELLQSCAENISFQ